jgi:hypothetical protein
MYSQVYFHHVRRAYDIHLIDFMKAWLGAGNYPTDPAGHLRMVDDRVMSAMFDAAEAETAAGHVHAKRILQRGHFRRLYSRAPADVAVNPQAAQLIFEAAKSQFGEDSVRFDTYVQRSAVIDFPVLMPDRNIASARALSETLQHLPVISIESVYIDPKLQQKARTWLAKNKTAIIAPLVEE